jgi:hypothetical protein
MVSFSNTKPTIFKRLAIQFSEIDPVEDLPAPDKRAGVLPVWARQFVEGVCL